MLVDHRGRPLTRKKQAMLVIMVSDDEKGPFKPVRPEDVPDWVKDPDVLGRMVNGEMCRNEGPWFLAVRANEKGQVEH